MTIKKFLAYMFEERSIFTFIVILLIFMIIPAKLFIDDFFIFDIKGEYHNIDMFVYKNINNLNNLYKSNFDKIGDLYIGGREIEISDDKKYICIYSKNNKQSIQYEVSSKNDKIYLSNPIEKYPVFSQILRYIWILFVCACSSMCTFAILAIVFENKPVDDTNNVEYENI